MASRDVFSPAQTRAARALLGWSQERLAEASRLELEAIELFEGGDGELAANELQRVRRALNMFGVIALQADLAGPGVRFRRPSSAPQARWAS